MAESKKYYWLKLKENFFSEPDIKLMKSMPNGKDYVILYLQLQLMSLKSEGILRYKDLIPYTAEMLATLTDTNVDTVKCAVDTFEKLKLVEIWDDGTIYLSEMQKLIGSEGQSAERVRRHREQRKALTPPLQCNALETKSNIEIEKEIELEKEIEKEKDLVVSKDTTCSSNLLRIVEEWNSLGISPIKKISPSTNRYTLLRARIKEYGEEEILKAISNIKTSTFLRGQNSRGWIVSFDWFIKPNNFIKVLEGKYEDKGEVKPGGSYEQNNGKYDPYAEAGLIPDK